MTLELQTILVYLYLLHVLKKWCIFAAKFRNAKSYYKDKEDLFR
jgi:hypothetical protein